MRVRRDRANGIIFLDQEKYVTGVLKRFNMLDSRPVATPAPSGMSMTAEEELPGLGPEIPYRSAVGSLLHAAIGTRFDKPMRCHKLVVSMQLQSYHIGFR